MKVGWSWTVFVVIMCERLGLGGEKGQNCNTFDNIGSRVSTKPIRMCINLDKEAQRPFQCGSIAGFAQVLNWLWLATLTFTRPTADRLRAHLSHTQTNSRNVKPHNEPCRFYCVHVTLLYEKRNISALSKIEMRTFALLDPHALEKNKGVRCARTNRQINLHPGHSPECL